MIRLRSLTAVLALTTAPALADITIDLGRGPVTIYVPDVYVDATPAPLIILLHGYSGTGAIQEAYMKFLPLAEEFGFLYAHPDGLVDSIGNQYWNATNACCDFDNSGVDDSGYLQALVDAVKAQLAVDARRVYFVGHSNGGFMSFRMACDHADTVAAIVSLAGATFKNENTCTPSEPVDILQIHGTNDGTILYGGGNILGVPYPGAVETAETWAAYATCDIVADTSAAPINLDKGIPGKETDKAKYESNCALGGSAELWTINGGGHVPNLANPFARRVVEWLYAHPKPGIDVERYCSPAVDNSTGSPGVLDAFGSDALANNDLTLQASDLPLNQFGYFLASLTQGFVANPGGSDGNLCLGGSIARLLYTAGSSGATGVLEAAVDLTDVPTQPPSAVLTGETWSFQGWYRDGATSNFTDGLAILFR